MPIDWLKSSNDDRKRLYQVMRAIEDATRLSPLEQLITALGRPVSLAHGYRSNFSKGRMRRAWAAAIHPWIAEHHRETAQQIDAALFPDPNISTAKQWQRWLDANAIRGKLTLHRPSEGRGLVEFVDQIPEPDATVKLGEPFCFAFDSDAEAPAALYQVFEGKWHAIPLAPDGEERIETVRKGKQLLPQDKDGQPRYLAERRHTGPHQFVLCVGAVPNLRDLETGLRSDAATPTVESVEFHVLSLAVGCSQLKSVAASEDEGL